MELPIKPLQSIPKIDLPKRKDEQLKLAQTTQSPLILQGLAYVEDELVRALAAANQRMPSGTLDTLSRDKSPAVRIAAAGNTHISSYALERLTQDEDPAVKEAAEANLQRKVEERRKEIGKLVKFTDTVKLPEGREEQLQLAKETTNPLELKALADIDDKEIQIAVAQNSKTLRDTLTYLGRRYSDRPALVTAIKANPNAAPYL